MRAAGVGRWICPRGPGRRRSTQWNGWLRWYAVSQGAKALLLAETHRNAYLVALLRKAGAEDDDGGAIVPAPLDPLRPPPPRKQALPLCPPETFEQD